MAEKNTLDASSYTNTYIQQNTLSGHIAPVTNVIWSPDGRSLASSSLDGTIHLWNGNTGELLYALDNTGLIWSMVWSPDGQYLASSSLDGIIHLWNGNIGKLLHTFSEHRDLAWSVAWSLDGQYLASGSLDHTVCLWDIQTGSLLYKFSGHSEPIITIAWSPDGQQLASGSLDRTICLWNTQTGNLLQTFSELVAPIKSLSWSLDGHILTSFASNNTIMQWHIETQELLSTLDTVSSSTTLCWSPDGRTLAFNSADHSISLFDLEKQHVTNVLEGPTDPVTYLSFSSDGQSLISFAHTDPQQSQGGIYIWSKNAGMWLLESVMQNIPSGQFIAFHPKQKTFAVPDTNSDNIAIWERDDTIYSIDAILADTIYYRNAKVVLVGDSGVGKTGLGIVLSGQPFIAPESSTHGRHIWTFGEKRIFRETQCVEIREILLWDLAGQSGYRLIHQLHLDEVTIALIVFDTKNETDPFSGVVHWERALRQAQYIRRTSAPPIKKFLVAARVDRSGIGMSAEKISTQMQKYDIDSFFKTSAIEGTQIEELKTAIEEAILWEELPAISSTRLFQTIRTFLIGEKESGRLLDKVDSLYRLFLLSKNALLRENDIRAQFETCIGRIESAGLIKRLSFGDLVLLQPELLDAYASALINAARDEPNGFGSIVEEDVRLGKFSIPEDVRLKNKEQEKFLLIALIEDLLRRELVLREDTFLVFPSQSTREYPDLPEPKKKAVVFTFDGPILNIYATLAVRVANSGIFRKDDLWKNAVTYVANAGGLCGILLSSDGEGHGELSLFFDEVANKQTRLNFEDYVQLHLQRKALPGSLIRRRIFACEKCDTTLTDEMVQKRIAFGFDRLKCPVCETEILLLDREKRIITQQSSLNEIIDYTADQQRDNEATKSILAGKREHNEFDVFLCCSAEDKPEVKKYGEQLKKQGILPWLDEWELRPGIPEQPIMEKQITLAKSAAVFVGKGGIEAWEQLLTQALVRQFVDRKCPVIPVLLAEATKKPELPIFLREMRWVDFRQKDPDPFGLLVWGITGKNPYQ